MPILKFAFGVLARFLAQVAEQLARWLFDDVSQGRDEDEDAWSVVELWDFARWFLRNLAGHLGGRSPRYDGYDHQYQPGFYGN
ncbi:hypothetical protein AYO44_06755 [Planctomycetaceae bacterium SCGC AG-212-F19]|nr:hypothetical protein AYO44_06755 [Planctomycetaceae bacterium SCGC AG-212-F19]